jgi:hypothetical protein
MFENLALDLSMLAFWVTTPCKPIVCHADGVRRLVLRLPTGLLFILRVIYECGELKWNDIDRGKSKNWNKSLSQCHYFHHIYHMDRPEREPEPPRLEAGD